MKKRAITSMKRQPVNLRNLFLLFVFIVIIKGCGEKIKMDTHFTSFHHLRKQFKDVPGGYKTVPFWVWNTRVTKELIDEQLRDYADKGFGGVFVHPRYGLITEYASEEWYSLVAYAEKRARKLGLDLWLYDENSFPSGFGGGLVPAEMPSSYNEGSALKLHHQSILKPDSTKEYLLVYLQRDSLVDITHRLEEFIGKKGDYLLFEKIYFPVSDWYAGYSYVDLIKPGVTEKFIEVTMRGYEEHMRNAFGSAVPGIFTDEPNIAPQGGTGLIRWTPDLFDQFYKRWNYKLGPNLISLIDDTQGSNQVRHNYYQLLLELFIDRWSKPWFEYTENNNLAWTGHYWEHGWPSPHHGPDNMAMYAWHQVPGIDMLFNTREERPDQFGNIRAVRELNSVANQLGRVRKLSETYGGSGWELDFEDMKLNGDWEYVLGVNLMNQHLSYQTLTGDRKHDFPQSISYQAPYWDEYPVMNAYFGRLSLALSAGEQINRTLVLEPTSSAWMSYSVDPEKSDLSFINDDFSNLLEVFESDQIEYDLGSENIIRDQGSIEGELFIVGKRKYNYVIIPRYMNNLNSETADLLEEYLSNGGIVISLCKPPEFIDGVHDTKCKDWTARFSEQWYSVIGCDDPRLINYLRSDDFIVGEQEGGNLLHMRRQLEDGQLLFLVNSDKQENCFVRLILQGKDMLSMNLNSGEMENYPCVVSNGILSFDATLDPGGSLLLFIGENELKGKHQGAKVWNKPGSKITISDISVEADEENVLTMDYCSLILDKDTVKSDYFYKQQTRIFNHYGFEKNPWVSASQFKTEIIDRDTFPAGSGFRAIFSLLVDSDFHSEEIKLVVERPYLYEVKVNGNSITPKKDAWWLDKEFGVFMIGGNLVPGENEIELNADPMSVYCELEPIYLVGDFNVVAAEEGWIVAKAGDRKIGSWKSQGMPFYSGKMNYTAEFTLDYPGPAKIRLNKWQGTVASVTINGNIAGYIYKKPYELRVDDYIQTGGNTVTVSVTGSLKNLLGPHHNVKQRGIVTPWSFKYGPETQPSGADYDLLDYGLMEPFSIEIINQ